VNNFRHAFQSFQNRRFVPDITDDHLDLWIQAIGLRLIAMHLLDKTIEDANPVPTLQTGTRNIAANEARAASDENGFCHRYLRTGLIGISMNRTREDGPASHKNGSFEAAGLTSRGSYCRRPISMLKLGLALNKRHSFFFVPANG
jgi:hypothetical protein